VQELTHQHNFETRFWRARTPQPWYKCRLMHIHALHKFLPQVQVCMWLRYGDRGGHGTVASWTTTCWCLLNRFRTARPKCVRAPSYEEPHRVCNEPSSNNNRGKCLRWSSGCRGPVGLLVRYKDRWGRSIRLWKIFVGCFQALCWFVRRPRMPFAAFVCHCGC
jgi:hypothetical protein